MSASYTQTADMLRLSLNADELRELGTLAEPIAQPAATESVQPGERDKKRPLTSAVVKEIMAELGVTLRLNIISGDVDIRGLPKGRFSKTNAANVLPVFLMDYMRDAGIKCQRTTLDDCLALIADENRFNPVEDMLTECEWDGQDRFEALNGILGLEMGSRESTYLMKWLWQSVALALNDEERPFGADGVLVLQGAQGCGKTRFFTVLSVSPDWFAEGVSIDTDKVDTRIQATGVWIAELGELDSTLKRDQSALKAFLTAARDTYRVPYARAAVKRPRRTSFAATVNPDGFLNDETGSRRYWTVHVDKIDLAALEQLTPEWMCQLWRQVYTIFYLNDPQGFRLTTKEGAQLREANKRYDKPLPCEIEVRDLFKWELHESLWDWFKVSEIKEQIRERSNASGEQIGRVLKKLAAEDPRIQTKNPGNVRQYRVPLQQNKYSYGGLGCG